MDDAQENDRLDELECLRAEDAERVELLNRLVAEFMEQYHREGVSLSSYITGPWWERMDMIEAEEENAQWSAEERNALLSIGVIPHDEDTDEMEETESEAGSESSVESVDVYQAEFWIRRIDRIAGV
jgi:hypothetical protein